jgi:aminobenzoyl-glutamate utilization protein B
MDYPDIKRNFDTAIKIAQGAALMTDTEMAHRILGTAWPRHFNRVIAETMDKHIRAVGLPEWSEADQTLAKAVQSEVGNENARGLATELDTLEAPTSNRSSGGSDDIGDISWVVPTVTFRYPSNIPGLPGHHWSNAIAMATPIAHKGATAGAKVMARTALEFFLTPKLADEAWTYFRNVQTKDRKYIPFISATDPPPVWLNTRIMAEFKPKLTPFYYDETRYGTYLEQLGITYPTLRSRN